MKTGILFAALFAVLSVAQAGAQELKIATVDMKRLVRDYYRSEEAQQDLNEKQALLVQKNNEKQKEIQDLNEELEILRKQLSDPSLNEAKKKELLEELRKKNDDGTAMNRSLREFLDRKRRQVQDDMQRQMRGILEEITQLLEEKAKAEGFDFVFDKSGSSTTQVPVVLYSKDTFDVTESLLKELNKDAPEK